jgi:hypothetical protein
MKKLFFILIAAVALAFTACEESEEIDVYNPTTDGLIGEWQSSGTNVAALLKVYFKVDSIYANFKDNNTYLVESFSAGAKTTYAGVFTQTKSTTGSIWTIKLEQSTPTAVTSEGIFEITTVKSNNVDNYTMKYEVVQTTPSIGATPPTPAAGFGSSNGGALLLMNVQNFAKIVK